MDGGVWEGLEGAQNVTIVYLPSDPRWSRLVTGEIYLSGSPVKTLLIGILSLIIGAGSLTAIARGYAGFDKRDGRLRLVRKGDIDEDLEFAARIRHRAGEEPSP